MFSQDQILIVIWSHFSQKTHVYLLKQVRTRTHLLYSANWNKNFKWTFPLASFSPMGLPVPARRSELPASVQGLIVTAVYFTYDYISKTPAPVSTRQDRAVSAAVYWLLSKPCFSVEISRVSSWAGLQAESSPLPRKNRPVSLQTRDVSETAESECTDLMLCNRQRDKQPVRVTRRETTSWPETGVPSRQSSVLLPLKCCMRVRLSHFRQYTVELQRIKGVWWGSVVRNHICAENLQWLGLSRSEIRRFLL